MEAVVIRPSAVRSVSVGATAADFVLKSCLVVDSVGFASAATQPISVSAEVQ